MKLAWHPKDGRTRTKCKSCHLRSLYKASLAALALRSRPRKHQKWLPCFSHTAWGPAEHTGMPNAQAFSILSREQWLALFSGTQRLGQPAVGPSAGTARKATYSEQRDWFASAICSKAIIMRPPSPFATTWKFRIIFLSCFPQDTLVPAVHPAEFINTTPHCSAHTCFCMSMQRVVTHGTVAANESLVLLCSSIAQK